MTIGHHIMDEEIKYITSIMPANAIWCVGDIQAIHPLHEPPRDVALAFFCQCLKLDTVRLVDLGNSVGWIVWTPMFNADGTVHSAESERTLGARPTWGTATWNRASRDPTQTYDEERYPRHLSFRRIVPLDSDRFEPPPQVADELGIDTPLLSI